MIFKRIAAWIAYEIREEKITLSSQDAKRILMDVAPPVSGAERFDMISRL